MQEESFSQKLELLNGAYPGISRGAKGLCGPSGTYTAPRNPEVMKIHLTPNFTLIEVDI